MYAYQAYIRCWARYKYLIMFCHCLFFVRLDSYNENLLALLFVKKIVYCAGNYLLSYLILNNYLNHIFNFKMIIFLDINSKYSFHMIY